MRGSCAAALVAASLWVVAPQIARAQDASNQAAAQALFDQARQLMTEAKYAEACPKLAESQRLDPGAGTLINLGACYEKNGQTASAWVTFKDAAAAADLKRRGDWSQRARERSQALEPVLSKITIDVPPTARPEGLQVRRDGQNLGSAEWGVPIPIDPGDHTIEAVAPNKKRWTSTVKVGPNADQAHVAIPALEDEPAAVATPIEAPAPPPAPSPAPPDALPPQGPDGSSQRTIALVVGGVGVAGLALGSIFGFIALGKSSDAKSLCPTSPGCSSQAGVQANDDAKSAATISTIAMIAGGAALATGAVIFFTAPKNRTTTALRVGPAIGAGELGLRIGGAW